jgi:mutator protein MutT
MKTPASNTAAKVVAAVIEKERKVLIARRRKEAGCGGLWEFPGGNLEEGETPEKGLEREIREELGLNISVGGQLCTVRYKSKRLSIELLAYHASIVSGETSLTDHDEIRWVEPPLLNEKKFSAPDRPVVRRLLSKSERPWKA